MILNPSVFALMAVTLWSTNALVAKYALFDMTVAQILTLQFAGAAVVFAVLAWRRRTGFVQLSLTAHTLGIVGLVGTVTFQYIAFATAPIAVANLISYAWPLLTAGLVVALGMTRKPIRSLLASALGFCGVLLLIGGGALPDTSQAFVGLLAATASAVCMAVYSVLISRTTNDPARLLLPAAVIGAVGACIWWVAGDHGPVSLIDLAAGLYLGIGPMGLGYALWSRAMQHGTAGSLATLGYATPVFSTGLLIASGEHITEIALIGAAIIVIACVLARQVQSPAHERLSRESA